MTRIEEEMLERAAKAIAEARNKITMGSGLVLPSDCVTAKAAISAYLGDTHVVVPRTAIADVWKEAEKCVPTNWCDDLLTGPGAPRGPLDSPAVEKLLLGIINRIRDRAMLRAAQDENGELR